jgi:hypothetical protein
MIAPKVQLLYYSWQAAGHNLVGQLASMACSSGWHLDEQKVIRVLVSICLRVGEKKTRNSHLEKSITGKNLKSWLGEVLNSWTLKSFLLMTGLLKTCGCPKLPGGGGEEGKSEREQEREREGKGGREREREHKREHAS